MSLCKHVPLLFVALVLAATALSTTPTQAASASRPNIVLVVGEDMGPDLGAYGCQDAITPNMDRLAREGALFTRAFTHCGVCAPSRSGMITGRYPLCYGGQNMRSVVIDPPRPFTERLRAAGYRVLWPGKTDFNGVPMKELADDRTEWLGGPKPQEPFFAFLNLSVSHESKVNANEKQHAEHTRGLAAGQRRDPATVALPPIYPDDPVVRRAVANYHELVTVVDGEVGRVMDWLKEHGLEENTVVIVTGDHGRGMPRFKRSVKDSGTRVPLIVRWPGTIPPGTVREDFASWIDFAPTALSLSGVPIPPEYDGHCFLPTASQPPRYVYSFRDCMDEDCDRVRSVRDERYRYVRNATTDRSEAGYVTTAEGGPIMQVIRREEAAGRLNAVQSVFVAASRDREWLFDTEADPWEVHNLAGDPAYATKLVELRDACQKWVEHCGELGELDADALVQRGIIEPRDPKYAERIRARELKTATKTAVETASKSATPAAQADYALCVPAHYSFGTTVDAAGNVLFTEFSHRRICRWKPPAGELSVVQARDLPGMFGIAAGADGELFVAQDLGDTGNPGKILRLFADGRETPVVEQITRPRQLACDAEGNLWAVLEGGRVITWRRGTGAVEEVLTAMSPVSGVAVGKDGSVYVSEYGQFDVAPEGYSRPVAPGRVKVRRPDGTETVLATGFWRARGLAIDGDTLFLCSESDREDHGNAGQLVQVDAQTGKTTIVLDGVDYPQFPAVGPTGIVFFTLARDNQLVSFDPTAPFRPAAPPAEKVQRTGLEKACVRGGSIGWEASAAGVPFSIRAQELSIAGHFQPAAGSARMEGWFEIPAERFQLNPNDLYPHHDAEHPGPGLFELPQVESTCGSGRLQVDVLPQRRHQGCRWPMQHVGTSEESPAPGFSEQPEAFRFYFRWTAAP